MSARPVRLSLELPKKREGEKVGPKGGPRVLEKEEESLEQEQFGTATNGDTSQLSVESALRVGVLCCRCVTTKSCVPLYADRPLD